MKVSREQAALNRERVVEIAAKLFREKGYNGIGVADLMKSAGLTHGGFYGNFASKETLLVEACQHALQGSSARWQRLIATAATPADALSSITGSYLSREHLANPGLGCTLAALGPDVGRQSDDVRHTFTQGAQAQLDLLAGVLQAAGAEARTDGADARRLAIERYAAMIGAVVLARAVDDTTLADEILGVVTAAVQAGPAAGAGHAAAAAAAA